MHNHSDSQVIFTDEDLDDLIFRMKEKVYEAWNRGYQSDISVDISFEKEVEE